MKKSNSVLKQLTALRAWRPPPDKDIFKHVPHAVSFLLSHPLGGLLVDPGAGKTLAALLAARQLVLGGYLDKVLVVSTVNSCRLTWPDEVRGWRLPFEVSVMHGTPAQRQAALDAAADVYAVNFDGLVWLVPRIKELLRHGKRWWLIVDESTKVKHTRTQRFKLLKGILERFERRSAFTGTPSPNGYEDLFGQVYVMDLGARLGRYITQYRREYFYPTGYGGYDWQLQEDGEQRIIAKLKDVFYRADDRTLGLPPLHRVLRWVELPPGARRRYAQLERDFMLKLRNGARLTAVNAGVLSMRLRQVANGLVYDDAKVARAVHDAKLEELTDLYEQLQGRPLLVGYEFTCDGERIAKALRAPLVNGATPRKRADGLYQAFKQGGLPALVCQAGAAALSLNLQAHCRDLAWYGVPWDLEVYFQFMKRVHRGGQRHRVTAHHLLARDTIEEHVMWPVLAAKKRSQDRFLQQIKQRYL